MKKIIFYTLLALLVISLVIYTIYKFETAPSRIADFINDNPTRSSIFIIKNDSVILNKNSNSMMPLASTMKWIILLEYCNQIETKKLNKKSLVEIKDLSMYYMPNTDGGAHEKWLSQLKIDNKIINGKVEYTEIVRGMILFSSNACTEYITEILGIDNVNKRLIYFDIKKHDKIPYLVSYNELINVTDSTLLKKMSNEDIVNETKIINLKVKSGQLKLNKKVIINENKLKFFSDKLPKSTTFEYVSLMQKINSNKYVSKEFQNEMKLIFNPVIQKNNKKFKVIFTKGGSTESILTNAFYCETFNGDKYYVAYFLENLEIDEYLFLKSALNEFNLNFLTNQKKQSRYIKIINDSHH